MKQVVITALAVSVLWTTAAQGAPGKYGRTAQLTMIEQAKDGVRRRMREPKSAQFREVFFNTYQGKFPIVCGQVNSRNGFGGYTGFQHFIASSDTTIITENEMADGDFPKVWNQMCL